MRIPFELIENMVLGLIYCFIYLICTYRVDTMAVSKVYTLCHRCKLLTNVVLLYLHMFFFRVALLPSNKVLSFLQELP